MMFIQYEEGSMPLNLANPTDVGYDLAPKEDTLIVPGRNLVHTGIHILLPAHCEAQVRPRSGCNLKGMPGRPSNSSSNESPDWRYDADVLLGTIDPVYTGEIGIILKSSVTFVIPKGTRIAQLIISPVARVHLTEVKELPETPRGM